MLSARPLAVAQGLFLQSILLGQRQSACLIALQAFEEGHSIRQIYLHIFQESLFEVGRLWESNRISVAEEHRATSITQLAMAHLYPAIQLSTVPRATVMITGVEGEMHQVGANMVADVLEEEGYQVHFLGTNLPAAAVVDLVVKERPEIVGISATMLFSLAQVIELVSQIREQTGPSSPHIVLGGAAFGQADGLPQELGALGWAKDLLGAVALLGTIPGR